MSIAENISLKTFNTFGIDVQARWYAITNSLAELQAFIEWKKTQQQPLLVLGVVVIFCLLKTLMD